MGLRPIVSLAILMVGILRTRTAKSKVEEKEPLISLILPSRRSSHNQVPMEKSQDIYLSFKSELDLKELEWSVTSLDSSLLTIEGRTKTTMLGGNFGLEVPVKAEFLGHGGLKVRGYNVSGESGKRLIFEDDYPVYVLRDEEGERLSKLFTGLMIIVFSINNFLMGTQLDMQVIFECVKRPVGPVIGVFCQFFLMPLIAYGWGWAILGDYPTLWLGYFAVGCSPGGGASNFMTILLDGNIDLSVTMTFFSNFAAFILMPLWLYTLTRTFYPDFVDIPFFNIFASLLGLIIPACIGLAFISWKPEYAKKCRRWIKVTTVIILVLIFIFGVYANMYIFYLITWYTIVAGLLLPWTGYLLAFGIAFLVKQPLKDCWTIAIETGIQNAGIPIVLLKLSLPEPDGDLSLVIPICVNLLTTIPLWFLLLGRKIKSMITGKGDEIERQRASFDTIDNDDGEDFSGYEPKLSTIVEPTRVEFCRQSSEIICSQKHLPSTDEA